MLGRFSNNTTKVLKAIKVSRPTIIKNRMISNEVINKSKDVVKHRFDKYNDNSTYNKISNGLLFFSSCIAAIVWYSDKPIIKNTLEKPLTTLMDNIFPILGVSICSGFTSILFPRNLISVLLLASSGYYIKKNLNYELKALEELK